LQRWKPSSLYKTTGYVYRKWCQSPLAMDLTIAWVSMKLFGYA
jgi:hypothetical protein